MSKKRRKKLKKLAKVLGAGLAIAGLGRAFANRNARASTNADAVKAMTSDAAYSIPGGDETSFKVQDVKVNVPSQEPVVRNVPRTTNLGRMEGKGPKSGLIGQKKRSDYVQRAKDSAAADAMRAFRSNNAYRGNMMTSPDSILQGVPLSDDMISAKKGGRIVKGKKTAVRTGAAKRGFGRAFKGGKR